MNKNDKHKLTENTPAPAPEQRATEQAHEQAEKDIAADPDLSIHSRNDDLDEGELARLGENNTGLV